MPTPMRHAVGLTGLLLLVAAPLRAQSSYEQMQTFSAMLNQIRTSYVDSVTYQRLVGAAIDGVLGSLDPHSRFVSRADAERELAYQGGSLAGSGIVFDDVDGGLSVLTVVARSPGEKAGVSPGDRLLTINDTSTAGLRSFDIARRLTGEKGDKVRLLFERGSRLEPDTIRVNLKYDFIKPRAVTLARMVDPTTGLVRLSEFSYKSGEETEKAIKSLRGKGMKRLILDLRDNPGGFMGELVEVASLFLPKDTLLYRIEGRRVVGPTDIRNPHNGDFRELPLMLLVDEGSASASEALAGTLQDHDRALLLGRRTFGKALMQQAFPVPPQGDMMWLTVGRIVTPSGRIIQRSYQGLNRQQYYSFGGVSGTAQDTGTVFHTDQQRPVRGGGGIVPDVLVPITATLPGWWSVAADSGWIEAVADSVAGLLPKEKTAPAAAAWQNAPDQWQTGMVAPLLNRVHSRLKVTAEPDAQQQARLGRILAYRATEVRWGADAAEAFLMDHDGGLSAAMTYWDKLGSMLKRP